MATASTKVSEKNTAAATNANQNSTPTVSTETAAPAEPQISTEVTGTDNAASQQDNRTPENVKVSELAWSGRARAALKNGNLLDKSLAEVQAIPEEKLLKIKRLGQGSLQEIRTKSVHEKAMEREAKLAGRETGYSARRDKGTDNDVLDYAKTHPNVLRAIMAGELNVSLR